MDRYTLMCSKLTQLQDEWEPKTGDWVYRKDKKEKFCLYYNEEHGAPPRKYIDPYTAVYLPSLEALIEMLEEKRWMLNWKLEYDHHNTEYPYGTTDLDKSIGWFAGIVPQEAMLKLVAHELWKLTWDEKKETWE